MVSLPSSRRYGRPVPFASQMVRAQTMAIRPPLHATGPDRTTCACLWDDVVTRESRPRLQRIASAPDKEPSPCPPSDEPMSSGRAHS